jgi:hypothetical protein
MAFSSLDHGWSACFEARRRTAQELALRAGASLDGGSPSQDLLALQKIIDARLVGRGDDARLSAIDQVFGDAVTFALRMDWCLVTDQFGTAPVLRIEDSASFIGGFGILSSRISTGQKIDVRALYEGLLATLARELHAQPRQYAPRTRLAS